MKIKPQCAEPGCIDSAGYHRVLSSSKVSAKAYCLKHRNRLPGEPGEYVSVRLVRLRTGHVLA
jgi:hypothetical protein